MRQKSNSLSSEEEENLPPIPGVKLGPLLGKGSFGSVHYGTWNGAQIAVKVGLPGWSLATLMMKFGGNCTSG